MCECGKNSEYDYCKDCNPDVSESSLNGGLTAEEVQAVKNAMWIVDQSLQDNDIWPRCRGMAQKSLRVLHNFLDKCGC